MNDTTKTERAEAGTSELARLRAIARAILATGSDLHAAIGPVQDLRQLAERLSTMQRSVQRNICDGESWLPSGLAVSPLTAALCAHEVLRSAAFIQGASRAMEQAARRCEGRPVRVLYAGCGPFAFLLLPLLALWSTERATFTMLDIHADALAPARRLVADLGLDAGVTSWIQADAATIRLDPAALPDVIVSETMSAALKREPQVSIARNLLAQAPGALMVPASVRVDCALSERPDASTVWRDSVRLGQVFALDAATATAWDAEADDALPAATFTIPADVAPLTTLRLFTDITVFDGIGLTGGDCSLNTPRYLPGKPLFAAGQKVRFYYRLGADPGLDYAVLPG
ncbi:hypothetical protein [Massilia arenae]|uniref:Uncharacterized protein n=1 Tax=Massilia arenae TaxID=2603288 RepID=A0A5C7FWQ3_9BURK|nr:hypothetical protein [Massilia arenae]TXF96742.1 hypothetical protein FVD38_23240 [Massilia arenae]